MFNELIQDAGEFGLFQKFLTFGFLLLTMVLVCFANWSQIFILLVPPHRCRTDWDDISYDRNDTVPQCTLGNVSHSVNSSLDVQTVKNASCPYGYAYDLSEMFSSFATENNLVCEDSWKMYVMHVSYYSGAAVGAILAGIVADKYGRRRAYQFCVIVNIAADLASLFAPDVKTFAAARFFSSLGATNLTTVSFVLAIEFTGRKHRLLNLAVWCLTFTFTSTTIPWIAYRLRNWQHILAVTFIPSITALIVSAFIPESPSWLMTKERWDETSKLIQRISKVNGKNLSLDHIKRKLEDQKTWDLKGKESCKTSASLTQSAVALFGTPKRRKTTIVLSLLWMIATLCYVGNNLETSNIPFSWYLAFSIGGIAELPANLICLFALDKLGRRWTNVFFFIVGGTLSIVAGQFAKDKWTIVVISALVRMCFAANFDISFTFTSESFPTIIRGRGILLVRAFGSVANGVAPMIVYLSEIEKLLPMVVLGIVALFGAFLTVLLPETARQHLPHTLEDGERFGENQVFCFCPFAIKENKINPEGKGINQGNENKGFED